MRIFRPLTFLACLASIAFAPTAIVAQSPAAPAGTKVAFRACPIFTGIEGGCWIAINKGAVYDIGRAGEKPQPHRKVVVMGTVSSNVHFCPGVLLEPVTVRVTRQRCVPPKWPPAPK